MRSRSENPNVHVTRPLASVFTSIIASVPKASPYRQPFNQVAVAWYRPSWRCKLGAQGEQRASTALAVEGELRCAAYFVYGRVSAGSFAGGMEDAAREGRRNASIRVVNEMAQTTVMIIKGRKKGPSTTSRGIIPSAPVK